MLQLPDGLFGMDIFGGYPTGSSTEQQRERLHTNKKKHPNLKRKRKNKQAKSSRRKNRK